MSWFDENAPDDGSGRGGNPPLGFDSGNGGTPPAPTGGTMSPQGAPNGLGGLGSPNAPGYQAPQQIGPQPPGATPGGAPASGSTDWSNYTGNPNDPSQIAAYVQYLSTLPGADPTLASDPSYWIGKITETGGLTQGNIGYWNGRSKAGAGDAGGGGGGQGGFGSLAAGYGQTFGAPSLADFQNTPGYQAMIQQGEQGIQRSAAAKGSLLTGGTLKALGNYDVNAANMNYGDAFNRALQTFNTNYGVYSNDQNRALGQYDTLYNGGLNAINAGYQ